MLPFDQSKVLVQIAHVELAVTKPSAARAPSGSLRMWDADTHEFTTSQFSLANRLG